MLKETFSMGPEQYLGKIPARQDIVVLTEDIPNNKTLGWTIVESMGVGTINNYPMLPWYNKIFRIRFWVNPIRNVLYKLELIKHRTVYYCDHIG